MSGFQLQEEQTVILVSPLFVALTKPPMVFGVTLDYFGWTLMFCLCGFILLDSALMIVLYIPLHALGSALLAFDPNIFTVTRVHAYLGSVPNRRIWRCNSYAAF